MKTSKKRLKRIGVFGGTFDPPHVGHVEISKFAIKKLKLSLLVGAVTKKKSLEKITFCNTKKKGYSFKKKSK